MVKNLPQTLSLEQLSSFDFGNIEAKRDVYLDNTFCFCDNQQVRTVLKGTYNLILGDKGTGKTALFQLLSKKRIRFKTDVKYRQTIIIPVEANYDLVQFSEISKNVIGGSIYDSKDEVFRFQTAWELYLIY
ncbi:MAG: hypothetical protein KAT05_05815 [Spirochaetes bacterium]|nr:hypothetical protein [Spirochaetota bacterium]